MPLSFRLGFFYFAFFLYAGLYVAYFPVYLAWRGLGAAEIAWVVALPAFVRVVAPIFWGWVADRTGWKEADVTRHVAALVVTHGGEGSTVYTADGKLQIPPAPARAVVDPTGCGDAYRAGLLHGLMHGLPWEKTGRIASVLGSLKIESRGTQNHKFTEAQFRQRYETLFGTL